MKEIWSNCWEQIKEGTSGLWDNFITFWKEQLVGLKDGVVYALEWLLAWVLAVGTGLYQCISYVAVDVIASVGKACGLTVTYGFNKLIDWVKGL